MPWSGGTFTRIYNWVSDKNAAIPITASRMDGDSDDFTSGINNCIAKDGSNAPTANLNMGSFRLTALANGTALTDAATISQVQAGVIAWGIAGGAADALTLTLSPAQTTIADGTLVSVRAAFPNATATPTFAFNATTARTITKRGGAALRPGDIPGALAEIILRYNSANTRWELLNAPPQITILGKSGLAVTAPADTTEDTLATITVPANAIGANGFIPYQFNVTVTNDANAKTLRMRIGGTLIISAGLASVANAYFKGVLSNTNNATNAQRNDVDYSFTGGAGGVASSLANISAIDTTSSTTITITGQKATAGNTFTLNNFLFELCADGL